MAEQVVAVVGFDDGAITATAYGDTVTKTVTRLVTTNSGSQAQVTVTIETKTGTKTQTHTIQPGTNEYALPTGQQQRYVWGDFVIAAVYQP